MCKNYPEIVLEEHNYVLPQTPVGLKAIILELHEERSRLLGFVPLLLENVQESFIFVQDYQIMPRLWAYIGPLSTS